jgi:hypothetical protein
MHYEKLAIAQARTQRILDFLTPHFGKAAMQKSMQKIQEKLMPANFEIAEDVSPQAFYAVQFNEALLLNNLKSSLSSSTQNVTEQIYFSARCAGQEVARDFLRSYYHKDHTLTLSELIQALKHIHYFGESGDVFFSIRPYSDATVHYKQNRYLSAWQAAQADIDFMSKVQMEWVSGIIDILCPEITFHRVHSGIDQFYLPQKHAL